MAKIADAAATSQIALIGSPRLNATTPRQKAPMMAIAAQTILLAALGGGTVACIGCMAALLGNTARLRPTAAMVNAKEGQPD
jgi:hypothetical protein